MASALDSLDHAEQPGTNVLALDATLICLRRRPLLTGDRWKRDLTRIIAGALGRNGYSPVAFTILPDRVQLILLPEQPRATVHRVLYLIKRMFTSQVKRELRQNDRRLLKELTIREAPGRYVFRCWEPGSGEIRDIESAESLATAVEAAHRSPVEAGLCDAPEQWRWSSWRQHHSSHGQFDAELPLVCALPAEAAVAQSST